MLRRKVYDALMEWKENGDKPLVVYGQRQVGKTFIVDEFAKRNYRTYIYANLNEDRAFRSIFEQEDRTIGNILLSMRVIRGIDHMDPEDTLIFLDEVQDCEAALGALKTFREDGRYKVVASGSMLGVDINPGKRDEEPRPLVPVGQVTEIRMTSLDFEEFLWANGIPQDAIDGVRSRIAAGKPIGSAVLNEFSKLFRTYQVVGGMPAAVRRFVEDRTTFAGAFKELDDILSMVKRDITKYSTPENAAKTAECFESIPAQLAETNKRFHYSRVDPLGTKGGSRRAADRYMGNLVWIKQAGYGNFCYALKQIASPLTAQVKRDVFRVYLSDTGMLTRMYGDRTAAAVFTSDPGFNKGAITENVVAECMYKCGFQPCYYLKNNGENRMEIDFVVEFFGGPVAIEVKSGKDRSAPSIWKVADHFRVHRRIMLEDGDVWMGEDGIEHYPIFAAAFMDSLDQRPGFLRAPGVAPMTIGI